MKKIIKHMKYVKYRSYINSISHSTGNSEINESRSSKDTLVTVYHGSDTKFTKIDPKYMFLENGNSQEGVGLYCGNLETAQSYGKFVYKIQLNRKFFKKSHGSVDMNLPKGQLKKFMVGLWKSDPEAMFMWCTDYGIYATEEKDITVQSIMELVEMLKFEELRNFQIDIAQHFKVEYLVKLWMKCFKNIHGLRNDDYGFYVLISTDYKLELTT